MNHTSIPNQNTVRPKWSLRQAAWSWYVRLPNHPMKLRAERWAARAIGLSRVQVGMPGGFVMDMPLPDGNTINVVRCGCEEPITLKLVQSLVPKSTCFMDVGAHFGLFSLAASKLMPPAGVVVALEPVPSNYNHLLRNLSLNRCGNVYPVLAAAAAETGIMTLNDPGATSYFSVIAALANTIQPGKLTVGTYRLADLIEMMMLPPPDLIKIDVEGHEVDVLNGLFAAGNAQPRHIVFEYLPQIFADAPKTVDLLIKHGYQLKTVEGKAFTPGDEEVPEHNLWATLPDKIARSGSSD